MAGPLQGITVVDATQMIAGPMSAMLLADQGADVIKIEQPKGGDRLRGQGHRKGSIGALWAGCNRGKRDLVIDLTKPEAQAIAQRLIATADVFIQNFRPGVADRLGLGEPELRAINPGVVYVSVNGFGESGPYVDRKTYDYTVQALTGFAALQKDPTSGRPTLLRNAVIDKATAYAAAQAATAALFARERGAGGQHVRISMVDVALAFLWPDGMMQHSLLGEGVTPGAHLADDYQVYRTKDGYVAARPTSERQFPQLCAAMETPQWLDDPRLATLAAREQDLPFVQATIEAEFAKYRSEEVVARLDAQDMPAAAVVEVADVHLDPQIQHNGSILDLDRPHLGRVREARTPARFEATPTDTVRHAPAFDEHTDEILGELGYDATAVADLRARQVVGPR